MLAAFLVRDCSFAAQDRRCHFGALAVLVNAGMTAAAMPCLRMQVAPEGRTVVVVGDIHGQFHDLCRM